MAMSKGVEGQVVRVVFGVEMFRGGSRGWKFWERDTSGEESGMESGREGVRGMQVVIWVRAKIVHMDTQESGLVGRSIANDTQAESMCRYSGCKSGLRVSWTTRGS